MCASSVRSLCACVCALYAACEGALVCLILRAGPLSSLRYLYKSLKKYIENFWEPVFSYIKGPKNEVYEKLHCAQFPRFPQIPQDFQPAHIAVVISEKSALCFQKKRLFNLRKKTF